jgi:hypothetical protein
MSKAWPWIFGIAVVLIIIGLVFFARSDPQAYSIARGAVIRPAQPTQVQAVGLIRIPCRQRSGPVDTAKACGFYVWKK